MTFPAPRQRRFRTQSGAKALLVTLAAALAAAPLAAVWGIGHARVEDYFGPHRAEFASNYSGELQIDLGPIGNAYLPSPISPVGVVITVHGVGGASESVGSLFSERTLAAYTSLYTDPAGVAQGIVERLRQRAVIEGSKAEAVLLLIFVGFRLRHRWLAESMARPTDPAARAGGLRHRARPGGRVGPGTPSQARPADPGRSRRRRTGTSTG